MFEKAWGTTCGVCANLLSTTLYQLPLCGGMPENFPISRVFDMLSLTECPGQSEGKIGRQPLGA